MSRALAVAVVAAGALLAGGCGGGDDRLSEDEFRQQANDICTDVNDQLEGIEQPSTPDEVGAFVSEAIPVLESGLDRLHELNPPEDLEDDYDRFLAEADKSVPAARKLQQAAEDQDPDALQDAVAEGDAADQRSDDIARDLGLTGCASN
jgi:hypothetical protein